MRKKLKKEVVNGNAYAKGYMGLTPTKEGYTFKGWSYKGKVYTPPYTENAFGPITGDADISAVWERNTSYTVYTIENVYPYAIPSYPVLNRRLNTLSGDFDITLTADFYKKTGNNPKELCECYCCIYKLNKNTGKLERVYKANNGQPTNRLEYSDFFDCREAISYVIYIGSSAMPDPNSSGNKNISAYKELPALYYDIKIEKPMFSAERPLTINEGDDLIFKAKCVYQTAFDSPSTWYDCGAYACLANYDTRTSNSTVNGWEIIHNVNSREYGFDYTVKNVKSYINSYKLAFNPLSEAKLDNNVVYAVVPVTVIPSTTTEYYILVENQTTPITVDVGSEYTIKASFYKKVGNNDAELCDCYSAILQGGKDSWYGSFDWKSTQKSKTIEQKVSITPSYTTRFRIFMNPDKQCTLYNSVADFYINVNVKYFDVIWKEEGEEEKFDVEWKDGDFPQ